MTNKLLINKKNVDSAHVHEVQTSITPAVKESEELGLCLSSVTSLPSSNASTSQDSASWPPDEAHRINSIFLEEFLKEATNVNALYTPQSALQ